MALGRCDRGPLPLPRAWTITTAPTPAGSADGFVPGMDAFEAAIQVALDEQVAGIRADDRGVEIVTSVVHGNAAAKMIEASDQVDLVVIGSRGRGGFAGLLLGSTSGQVVQHARRGVLVDRGIHESAAADDEEMLDRALASELGVS